jgi:hypothetical protein
MLKENGGADARSISLVLPCGQRGVSSSLFPMMPTSHSNLKRISPKKYAFKGAIIGPTSR